jgi:hypothetical protein
MMLQNPRLKHLLAAGMLTGLVLATLIAFAWRDTSRTAADATQTTATLTMAAPAGTDTGQAENAQLRQAVATMRAREKEYHTQLEAANRTIMQLQEVAANPRGGDPDAHEDHEHADEHREDDDD